MSKDSTGDGREAFLRELVELCRRHDVTFSCDLDMDDFGLDGPRFDGPCDDAGFSWCVDVMELEPLLFKGAVD